MSDLSRHQGHGQGSHPPPPSGHHRSFRSGHSGHAGHNPDLHRQHKAAFALHEKGQFDPNLTEAGRHNARFASAIHLRNSHDRKRLAAQAELRRADEHAQAHPNDPGAQADLGAARAGLAEAERKHSEMQGHVKRLSKHASPEHRIQMARHTEEEAAAHHRHLEEEHRRAKEEHERHPEDEARRHHYLLAQHHLHGVQAAHTAASAHRHHLEAKHEVEASREALNGQVEGSEMHHRALQRHVKALHILDRSRRAKMAHAEETANNARPEHLDFARQRLDKQRGKRETLDAEINRHLSRQQAPGQGTHTPPSPGRHHLPFASGHSSHARHNLVLHLQHEKAFAHHERQMIEPHLSGPETRDAPRNQRVASARETVSDAHAHVKHLEAVHRRAEEEHARHPRDPHNPSWISSHEHLRHSRAHLDHAKEAHKRALLHRRHQEAKNEVEHAHKALAALPANAEKAQVEAAHRRHHRALHLLHQSHLQRHQQHEADAHLAAAHAAAHPTDRQAAEAAAAAHKRVEDHRSKVKAFAEKHRHAIGEGQRHHDERTRERHARRKEHAEKRRAPDQNKVASANREKIRERSESEAAARHHGDPKAMAELDREVKAGEKRRALVVKQRDDRRKAERRRKDEAAHKAEVQKHEHHEEVEARRRREAAAKEARREERLRQRAEVRAEHARVVEEHGAEEAYRRAEKRERDKEEEERHRREEKEEKKKEKLISRAKEQEDRRRLKAHTPHERLAHLHRRRDAAKHSTSAAASHLEAMKHHHREAQKSGSRERTQHAHEEMKKAEEAHVKALQHRRHLEHKVEFHHSHEGLHKHAPGTEEHDKAVHRHHAAFSALYASHSKKLADHESHLHHAQQHAAANPHDTKAAHAAAEARRKRDRQRDKLKELEEHREELRQKHGAEHEAAVKRHEQRLAEKKREKAEAGEKKRAEKARQVARSKAAAAEARHHHEVAETAKHAHDKEALEEHHRHVAEERERRRHVVIERKRRKEARARLKEEKDRQAHLRRGQARAAENTKKRNRAERRQHELAERKRIEQIKDEKHRAEERERHEEAKRRKAEAHVRKLELQRRAKARKAEEKRQKREREEALKSRREHEKRLERQRKEAEKELRRLPRMALPTPKKYQQALLPTLPSIAPFLHSLSALVTSPSPPPSLYIHSPAQSQILLPALLHLLNQATASASTRDRPTVDDLLPKTALISLKDIHSVKAAFDRILAQLSSWDSNTDAEWDPRTGGVRAWHGDMDGVQVVQKVEKRSLDAADGGRQRKRPRLDAREPGGTDYEKQEEGPAEVEHEGGLGWTLAWDRTVATESDKPSLAPLRNTVDSFHHSLQAILSHATGSSPPIPPESALDAAATSPPSAQPARRFIVIEHGELLSELAGGSVATGAARETGVGLTFASTMYRLAQLTGLPLTVITISRLPWRKTRESMVGLLHPELLDFIDVGSPDAVTLLTERFSSSPLSQPAETDTLSESQLSDLFRSLAFVVRNTFGKSATDLEEHAYLCAKFWPQWKETVEKSNPPIAPTDTARLSIALKSEFAAELDRLALPRQSLSLPSSLPVPSSSAPPTTHAPQRLHGFAGTIATAPKQPTYLAPVPPTPEKAGSSSSYSSTNSFGAAYPSSVVTPTRSSNPNDPFERTFSTNADSSTSTTPLRQQALPASASASSHVLFTPSTLARQKTLSTHAALSKSLPVVARFLLLAAYFAAVNPPKSDVRMFVRVDEMEGVAKKGKKARKASAKKAGASPTKGSKPAALYGGKAFAYERMVAIFEAIVDDRREYALGTVAVAGQVQTLLHLRLLARASSESNTDKIFDGVKLKCPLAKDVVDALAQSVGWKEWRERLVGEEP
ncbi:hypothetical protein JCM11641_001352 [Rhodosporidiobolus odoratus]